MSPEPRRPRRFWIAAGCLLLGVTSCSSTAGDSDSDTAGPIASEVTSTTQPPVDTVDRAAPSTTESPDATAATAGGARRSEGQFQQGIVEFTVVDSSRPTDEVRDRSGEVVVEAAESRTIPVRVAYPAKTAGEGTEPAGTGFPLVIYAHGLGSRAAGVPGYFEHLVAAGYVVAGPDFPETAGAAQNSEDYIEQPADVSFVLDHLIARVSDPADELAGLFDPERIAIAGHSLGGLTAYALAFHDCCRDDRFDAALVYAGAYLFPEGELELSDLPTLFVTGTVDQTPGVELMPEFFEEMQGPAYLLTLIGEEHPAGLYGKPKYRRPTNRISAAFLDAYLKDDPTDLEAIEPVDGLYDWLSRNN